MTGIVELIKTIVSAIMAILEILKVFKKDPSQIPLYHADAKSDNASLTRL